MSFPIRMSHPLHGFTHAYDEEEKGRREKEGWAVEDVEAVEPPKKRGRPKKVEA